jgi:hypothetical protein
MEYEWFDNWWDWGHDVPWKQFHRPLQIYHHLYLYEPQNISILSFKFKILGAV